MAPSHLTLCGAQPEVIVQCGWERGCAAVRGDKGQSEVIRAISLEDSPCCGGRTRSEERELCLGRQPHESARDSPPPRSLRQLARKVWGREKEVGVGLRGRRRAETEEDGVGRLRLPDSLARKETATQTATQAASRRQRRAEAATQGRAATQGGGGDAPAALGGRELAFREELPSPKLPACEWPVRITHDAVRRRSRPACVVQCENKREREREKGGVGDELEIAVQPPPEPSRSTHSAKLPSRRREFCHPAAPPLPLAGASIRPEKGMPAKWQSRRRLTPPEPRDARRTYCSQVPVPRAGWLSTLLLTCLLKQCSHPAQGLTGVHQHPQRGRRRRPRARERAAVPGRAAGRAQHGLSPA